MLLNTMICHYTVAVIGFLNAVLNISEDGGTLSFNVGVISGTLRINVTVNFTSNDGTARCMSRGCHIVWLILFTCFTLFYVHSWTRLHESCHFSCLF